MTGDHGSDRAGIGEGLPPIIDAVDRGDTAEIARILAQSPGEIAAVDDPSIRMGVLHHAPTPEIAELLIRHGAEIDARDASGRTPLHCKAEFQSASIVRLLVQHGADVHAVDANGRTPLSANACSREPSPEIARLLIDHGATLDLRSALSLDWVEEARRMLAGDPLAITTSSAPERLLVTAVYLIHRALLNGDAFHGPALEHVDPKAASAIVTRHIDLIDALLARGAPTTGGFEALRMALELPDPAVAERLLSAGVPLSDPRLPGPPAVWLLSAAGRSHCREEMLALLRCHGITPENSRRPID